MGAETKRLFKCGGGEISQKKGDLSKILNEPPVKIGKPQKSLGRSTSI